MLYWRIEIEFLKELESEKPNWFLIKEQHYDICFKTSQLNTYPSDSTIQRSICLRIKILIGTFDIIARLNSLVKLSPMVIGPSSLWMLLVAETHFFERKSPLYTHILS